MTRRQTPAELAANQRLVDQLTPIVEAARRDAAKLPPDQRAAMPTLSAETSDRRARIAVAVRAFGAPAALADEINDRGLTLQQAHDLLARAAGRERKLSAAGVEQMRLALVAMDVAARDTTARADADRIQAVANLLHRFNLVGTHAGARVAVSKHDADTLRTLVQNRADAFGRINPCAQLALMRDLMFTPVKDTTQ